MKNKGLIISLIIFLSIIVIGLIVLFIIALNHNFSFNIDIFNTKISTEKIYEKNYEEIFNKIIINSNASKIEIKETNKEIIEVEVYGKEEKLTVKDKENLEIEYRETKCNFFCFNREIAKIVIYLPSNYENEVIIKNDLGNIEIGKFENITLDIEEDASNIKIEEAKNIKAKNDAGNITIGKVDIADLEDNAGNIKVDKVNIAKIKNDAGNITINEVNQKFEIENDVGNIEIDYVNITEDSIAKTDTGNIKINNKNDIYVEGSTSVGKVNIDTNNRKAEVKLDLKTDVGTIKVK